MNMSACTLVNEQDKGSNLLSIITWSVLGKQNVQAKEVYCTPLGPIAITNQLGLILILDYALMNQTMFLKFIFNQDMFRMKHHPSSVVRWEITEITLWNT